MPIRIPQPVSLTMSHAKVPSCNGLPNYFQVQSPPPPSQSCQGRHSYDGSQILRIIMKKKRSTSGTSWVGRGNQFKPRGGHSSNRLTCTSGHGLLIGGDCLRESPVPSSDLLRCLTTMQNLTPVTEGPRCSALGRNQTKDFSKDIQEAQALRQPR